MSYLSGTIVDQYTSFVKPPRGESELNSLFTQAISVAAEASAPFLGTAPYNNKII